MGAGEEERGKKWLISFTDNAVSVVFTLNTISFDLFIILVDLRFYM